MREVNFTILFILAFCATVATSYAVPVRRITQAVKLPNQAVMEYQNITAPKAAGTADILSASAGNTSALAATISTFVAQPDVPRNIVITPGGATGDIESCAIVVTGTNFFDAAITETITFGADQVAAVIGVKAFKSIVSVVFPANCESGSFAATWSVGYGEKIGLKRCMSADAVFKTALNGVHEGTRPTVYYDINEVEKNMVDFNGTMTGYLDFQIWFVQNFGCFR